MMNSFTISNFPFLSNWLIKSILLFAFLLSSFLTSACGNEYGHKLDGSEWHSKFFYLTPRDLKFDSVKLNRKLKKYNEKFEFWAAEKTGRVQLEGDKILSNKALVLMKLGRVKEAKQILVPIVKRNPQEYSMAANLGTVYELSGQLDSALKYISKGLAINPKSHKGSEWIHVEILKAKIKRKKDKFLIVNKSILSTSLIDSHRDTSRKFERRPEILRQIYYQAKTRAAFTPAPNEVMSNLLMSAGDYARKHDTYENALMAYAYARKYAKGWGQKSDAEERIKILNQIKDKLSHDKELDRMFFYTIKRAEVSPELLLLGLDEIAEALDSLNREGTNYQTKIDSLQLQLAKQEKVIEKKPQVVIKKEKNAVNLIFIALSGLLLLVSVFLTYRLLRKS